MNITVYTLILFFICLNVSLYIVAETQVLPAFQQPYVKPEDMQIIDTVESLAILTVGMIIAAVAKNWIFGAAAMLLWALDYLLPVVHWVLFGFPEFIGQLAASTGEPALLGVLTVSLQSLFALVWFWFILGFMTSRPLEV